jgi:hypothetical protein
MTNFTFNISITIQKVEHMHIVPDRDRSRSPKRPSTEAAGVALAAAFSEYIPGSSCMTVPKTPEGALLGTAAPSTPHSATTAKPGVDHSAAPSTPGIGSRAGSTGSSNPFFVGPGLPFPTSNKSRW